MRGVPIGGGLTIFKTYLLIPFFFIRVTTNEGLASIRAWMSVMDLEIWY